MFFPKKTVNFSVDPLFAISDPVAIPVAVASLTKQLLPVA